MRYFLFFFVLFLFPVCVHGQNGTVSDVEGHVYRTVIIGDQEWMAENLRTTSYANGEEIPGGLTNREWSAETEGAYSVYGQDGDAWEEDLEGIDSIEAMARAYGKLYNWFAATSEKGLCPAGWRVPTHEDWGQLRQHVMDQGYPQRDEPHSLGNAMKSCRQIDSPLGDDCETSEHPRWDAPVSWAKEHVGLDAFGFAGLPSGYRFPNGRYRGIGNLGSWWTATEESADRAWLHHVDSNEGFMYQNMQSKNYGLAIRCVRDVH